MKKYIFIFLVIPFFFSCTQTPQILQTACEISTEVCNYANLICNNLPKKDLTEAQTNNVILRLQEVKALLKSDYEKSEVSKLKKAPQDSIAANYALLEASNQLKKIVDELKIK